MNAPVTPSGFEKAAAIPAPVGLLAELTHRCPLACPYCSNPLALDPRESELSTDEWLRVFAEAASLGVLQLHLSGGEPAARRDLEHLVEGAAKAGLYSNLITSGVGLTTERIAKLADLGLDHIQLSIQDSTPQGADKIGGYKGGYDRKIAVAEAVHKTGLPLTINAVIHRANIGHAEDMVGLAMKLGAMRVEIAHVQYYGWGLRNRASLMPTRDAAMKAINVIERLKRELTGQIMIDHVIPDYHGNRPKACMGGWGMRTLNITPSGRALPCHAAETIPGLDHWSVKEHPLEAIWYRSPAFNAFRGDRWMKEPCRSCPKKTIDHGGCRCQALALTGDAANADPVCHLSPDHERLEAFIPDETAVMPEYLYRR